MLEEVFEVLEAVTQMNFEVLFQKFIINDPHILGTTESKTPKFDLIKEFYEMLGG